MHWIMKFLIKPADNSLSLILEAIQYNKIWAEHSRKIYKAFRDVSGLEFQQRGITAHVSSTITSMAGIPGTPMQLAGGDHRSLEFKLLTIIHELTHRLLGGNSLGPVSLGLVPQSEAHSDLYAEFEHRHVYLLEYDVVIQALGEEWGKHCRDYEGRYTDNKDLPHNKAWQWAMSMTPDERRRAVKILASKAVTRENWSDEDTELIDPEAWFSLLTKHELIPGKQIHQTSQQ